jgi:hypothetical protein
MLRLITFVLLKTILILSLKYNIYRYSDVVNYIKKICSSTTGQSTAGQSMAGQSMAGQSMAGQSTTGESTAGASTAGASLVMCSGPSAPALTGCERTTGKFVLPLQAIFAQKILWAMLRGKAFSRGTTLNNAQQHPTTPNNTQQHPMNQDGGRWGFSSRTQTSAASVLQHPPTRQIRPRQSTASSKVSRSSADSPQSLRGYNPPRHSSAWCQEAETKQ